MKRIRLRYTDQVDVHKFYAFDFFSNDIAFEKPFRSIGQIKLLCTGWTPVPFDMTLTGVFTSFTDRKKSLGDLIHDFLDWPLGGCTVFEFDTMTDMLLWAAFTSNQFNVPVVE